MDGGPEAARKLLDVYWGKVARKSPVDMMTADMAERWGSLFDLSSTTKFNPQKMLSGLFAAGHFEMFDANPLEPIVKELIDFKRLRKECPVKLFIGATEVRTGKLRVFENEEMTASVLLASACLPSTLFKGVEIDDEVYWDGGFSSNPPIYPLIFQCECDDIVTVLLGPLERKELPKTHAEILGRITELTFNSTYLREMQAITRAKSATANQFVLAGRIEREIQMARFHHIEAEELMNELSVFSKANTQEEFLLMLREKGRQRAADFLNDHFSEVGKSSTVDLNALFGDG
jgi:NTE family protein